MPVNRSTGFTESSGGSKGLHARGRFGAAGVEAAGGVEVTRIHGVSMMEGREVNPHPSPPPSRKGEGIKYGDAPPKQKRLLREALEFLESAAGPGGSSERTLKALFALYETIDPFADYIRPGEREFFPVLKAERTLERFLEGFKYIYYILRRAEERVRLQNAFDNFWARCTGYLAKCGYSEKYISDICGPESIFYRQSFAWWRREYGDREEGFSPMYEYFRACFGVEGNDDYCAAGGKDGVTYDWRRMKACYEREKAEQTRPETVVTRPVWEEWSEKNRKRMRELVESLRRESPEEMPGPPEADIILAEIRRRNRERGYFA